MFEGEARKVALNMKTTADVRERLETAAQVSGRSLTHEVEHRIQSSLDQEYLLRATFGAGFQAEMFRRLAYVVRDARKFCREHKFSEVETRKVIAAACNRVISVYCWAGGPLPQESHQSVHGKPLPVSKRKPEHIGVELADSAMMFDDDQAWEELDRRIANHWTGNGRTDDWVAECGEQGNPPGTTPLKDIMVR
ncbi:TraY domain-containing protein [Methylobacterium longum]|uniref:TraY domain-containing protein n=1 Tax=Methylobacterium longum TaxID=767694 RepID=A0ABT8AHI8_9HYPH|nr:TraY domain-containing protein [Methylobacterium longum]MDN3569274.1 TraY domain-containing protein [Methylobacterium longum]